MRKYYPVQGGIRKAKHGPWEYFEWNIALAGIDDFTRRMLGSYRQVEFVGKDKPAKAANVPYTLVNGIHLFMEIF